jgi:hypothetical protein
MITSRLNLIAAESALGKISRTLRTNAETGRCRSSGAIRKIWSLGRPLASVERPTRRRARSR